MGARAGATAGVAGLVCAAVIVVVLLPLMIAGAASAPTALCGPGGRAQKVGGVQLDAEQMGNAQTVVLVVARRGLPSSAATIALATVAAESMFHNDPVARDGDSLGLFQQRVRFYSAPVAASPARATNAFLDRLVTLAGWAARPLTEVAATVQKPRADLRGAYAKWQPLAAALTAKLWPTAATLTSPAMRATASTRTAPAVTVPVATPLPTAPTELCGLDRTAPAGGSDTVPKGLALTGSKAGNRAAGFALAQLGRPYLWGSTGPSSWDCSSLTQAGWAWAGVAIARTTFEQVNQGSPAALAGARSGDLLFIAGTDGTAASPGHVGMVAGRLRGALLLVSAPHAGQVVQLSAVAQWAPMIVSVRRIG